MKSRDPGAAVSPLHSAFKIRTQRYTDIKKPSCYTVTEKLDVTDWVLQAIERRLRLSLSTIQRWYPPSRDICAFGYQGDILLTGSPVLELMRSNILRQ